MVCQVDITQLFIAGAIPGIFLCVVVSAYGGIYAVIKKIPTIPFSFKKLKKPSGNPNGRYLCLLLLLEEFTEALLQSVKRQP